MSDICDADREVYRQHTSLAAVATKLAALEELLDERDRWYKERDSWYSSRDKDRQAEVEKALTANKALTDAAFAASKEAIGEAKKSQDSYNLVHNDLVRKMEGQNALYLTRNDFDTRVGAMDEKVQDLKAVLQLMQGRGLGTANAWTVLLGAVALVATLAALWGLRTPSIQYVPVTPGVSLPMTIPPPVK